MHDGAHSLIDVITMQIDKTSFSLFRYQQGAFTFSEGGFGGGGSGYLSASGGGGGFSGGGGGPPNGYSGGGGSYIKFSGGQELAEVTNDKSGFVVISVVGMRA